MANGADKGGRVHVYLLGDAGGQRVTKGHGIMRSVQEGAGN